MNSILTSVLDAVDYLHLNKSVLIFLGFLFPAYDMIGQEICNNGIDDDADGLIDCYDPDCSENSTCDYFFISQTATCQYMPGIAGFDLTSEWQTDADKHDVFSTLTPIAGDWDNDGVVEVFAYNHNGQFGPNAGPGNKIYIINGGNGIVEDSIVMPVSAPSNQTSGIAISDLNNDGFAEIVIMGIDARLRCYNHQKSLIWTSPAMSPALTPVVNIADFNQDGNPEVYCSAFIFNGQTGAQIATGGAFPPSGAVGAPIRGGGLFSLGMTVAADVLPTAFCAECSGLELVAGNKVFSVNIATGTLTVQVTANTPGFDGFTTVADYDVDGDLDGIIATDTGSPLQTFVFVWDLQTSTVIAVSPIFTSTTFTTIGQCTVGDYDGDGLPEVGVVTEDTYHVLDDHSTGLAPLWSKTIVEESGFSGSTLFDFQGDGIREVVYQDEDSLYVLNGATGGLLASRLCRNASLLNRPVVLDVDGDNQAEIVCGCSEGIGVDPRLHGYIEAFGPSGEAWVDARSVWNQSSYFVVNVNDDLSIPIVQQNQLNVGNGIVLNGFNNQTTILKSNGDPTFAASDASPSITSINLDNCASGTNTIEVTIKIDNLSADAVIPKFNPVALYNGDPAAVGATLIDTLCVPTSIPPSGNKAVNITIPDQGGDFTLYVVANDTGHIVTPIAFTTTGVGECNFDNNIVFQDIICSCPINTWEGNIDSDWFNPGNWSCAIIPDASSDVVIPMGTPPCIVASGMMAFAKNLTVDASATLTVNGMLDLADGN